MHKVFCCEVAGCSAEFGQKWLLKRHAARAHESKVKFCDTCAQHCETAQRNAGPGKCANRSTTTGEFAACDGVKDSGTGQCDKCKGEWLGQGCRFQTVECRCNFGPACAWHFYKTVARCAALLVPKR